MARRSRGLGLSAYFDFTAFDTNIVAIRETRSRDYLERRLTQAEAWRGYLSRRVERGGHVAALLPLGGQKASDTASTMLDFVYLEAVRRAIEEMLHRSN